MRVFILSTGRCGSATVIHACKNITNYTAAHESRTSVIGQDRLVYPDNHIESDNRLSWFLGSLNKNYGDNAIYVHLVRNKKDTVKSFNKRWGAHSGIMKAFVSGVLNKPIEQTTATERLKACELYYDTVNDNISLFLENKPKKMTLRLETIESDFELFWDLINAEGDLKESKAELFIKHNQSKTTYKPNLKYRLKLFLNRFTKG